MKKQKIKKFLKKNILVILFSFFIVGAVFGSFTSYIITSQYSNDVGSNNSLISFTGTTAREGYYVNDENNSAIIQNYFQGYYYDSLFGFFKLDWSTDQSQNVKIIDSTSQCSTGYGYKLGGKAFSEQAGYIDFNYNSSTFVYYCLDDGKLHGMAYGQYIGYQNFEGIQLSIVNDIVDLTENISSDVFTNDTTNINQSNADLYEVDENGEYIEDGIKPLGGTINQLETSRESIFYIIK